MTRTRWEILAATAVGMSALALAISSTQAPSSGRRMVEPLTLPEDPAPAPPLWAAPVVPDAVMPEHVERPRIEVVFALDTTGSMGGLIAAAKRKIWSIANQMASGQPSPDVRMGVVAYRDLGDAYVTRATPLMADLDEVYGALMQLRAEGGGDRPEHVDAALAQAIRETAWSTDEGVLRLVFLVGDAPPHDDYDDGLNTFDLVREAKSRGIVINAVRCGADEATGYLWRDLAGLAGGRYASIAQDGGDVEVPTPFDAALGALNTELADTIVGYGSAEAQQKARTKRDARRSMPSAAGAAAASYAAKSNRLNDEDLLFALEAGLSLDALPEDELPESMRSMLPEQRREFVERTKARRADVKRRILELAAQREAYLREKADEGASDGFDAQVLDMVRRQTAEIGIGY